MKKLDNRILLLAGILTTIAAGLPLHSATAKKNVLLLISDNQTWLDTGCYGNDVVQTPNIDRLAADGVRFEHAFATVASCGPSRAVIYTGLLTHSNGMYAHPHREHNQQIRDDVFSVFGMLKENGYRTGLIGKNHTKPVEKYPIDFEPRVDNRDVWAMAEEAREFVDADDASPFFLVMAYSDPHPISLDGVGWGVKPTKEYKPVEYDPADIPVPGFLPDTTEVRESMAGYYQQISRMDHGVGLMLDHIEETGHQDDTLVIFISDHGTSEPGAMGTQYEPGLRVPFVVRQPGLEKPGIVNRAMVAFTDITPTILDWTETEFDNYPLHGRSILPILDDPNPEGWDEVLTSSVAHDIFAFYPMRTLRERRYKLIWNVNHQDEYPIPIDTVQRRLWVGLRERGEENLGPREIASFLNRPQLELYDLETDPWEVNNLADDPAHAETRDRMVQELVAKLEKQKDPWLRNYHPTKPGQ